MRLMWYDYKVIYVPGKQLVLADCLSRNPIEEDHSLKDEFEEEISHYVRFVISHWPVSNSFLQRIKEEQGKDIVCRKLKDFCLGTWPNKDRLPSGLSVYFPLKDSISFSDGFLMYGTRLLIPLSL
ncbi:hypothetical protein X777_16668 [Ooceraea biroi]|uniref:Uncharacterized protein n=1 Tax=Ooceraea biroi TaxID=2015173 RepID=A0A026WUG4_OOCBI|nr:hypothetical protein X777_16668 [Ooceraea biroi]